MHFFLTWMWHVKLNIRLEFRVFRLKYKLHLSSSRKSWAVPDFRLIFYLIQMVEGDRAGVGGSEVLGHHVPGPFPGLAAEVRGSTGAGLRGCRASG